MKQRTSLSFFATLILMAFSSTDGQVCCNYPAEMTGSWIATQSGFTYTTVESQPCNETTVDRIISPSGPIVQTNFINPCNQSAELIDGSYFALTASPDRSFFYCVSHKVLNDIRFFLTLTGVTGAETSANCSTLVEQQRQGYALYLPLPLTTSQDAFPCPWALEDIGVWQAYLGSSLGNPNVCDGTASSVIALSAEFIEFNLCTDSLNGAVSENAGVKLRCMRKWEASQMSRLGNDSLGQFAILAVDDAAELAAGTAKMFVARFLKRGVGDYTLGVDWTSSGSLAWLDMNPETADTSAILPNKGRVYVLSRSPNCCDYPNFLLGDWYSARALILTDGPYVDRREFYTNNVETCAMKTLRMVDSPSIGVLTNNIQLPCFKDGMEINGTYYVIQYVAGLPDAARCASYDRSNSREIIFNRNRLGLLIGITKDSAPEACYQPMQALTEYRVEIRLPLDDGTTGCPWASEPLIAHQTTISYSGTSNVCSGNAASTITFQQKTFRMNTCQSTTASILPVAVGAFENADVEYKCLRTWVDSEMSPLTGNDTTGTYFMFAINNQTSLADATENLFIGKYIKTSDGNFKLLIDWRISETAPFGFFVELNMDENTALQNSKARIYDLTSPPEPTTSTPVSTTSSDMGTTATSDVTTSMMLSDTTSMMPSDTTSMMPSDTTSMMPSDDTTTMIPSDTTSMMPSDTTSMMSSDTTSMMLSDTTSMMPSDTTSMMPSDTTLMMPSDTTSMMPSDMTSMMSSYTTTSMMSSDTASMMPSDATSMMPSYTTTSMMLSDTTSMMPSYTTTSMMSSDTASMMPSDTTSMMPSDTTSMMPSYTTTSMISSDTASMMPSDTTSMMPSDTTSMMPSYTTTSMMSSDTASMTTSMMPSDTTSMMPSYTTTSMMPSDTTSMMPSDSTSIMPSSTTVMPSDTAVVQPTSTSETQTSTVTPQGDVGIAEIQVDGAFNTVTDGNPVNYCRDTQVQIAARAGVDVGRIENVECRQGSQGGSVEMETHISEGGPGEPTIGQALDNLLAAIDEGFNIESPRNRQFSVNPRRLYIRFPNGTEVCRGDYCTQAAVDDDSEPYNKVLVYTIIGIAAFIILVTILLVVCCICCADEREERKEPFQDDDSFGMARHWQASYVSTMKPNGGNYYG